VVLDRSSPEREITADAPPLEGTPDQLTARLRELHDASADEIILVVSPITERSVRALAEVVAAF
jgi:alkanesulfonate monooxygenase SsuD/methylene tetrahydromethanopterin reductase-like flavin-dependent oxidoreductase (luciferase family)